MTRTRDESCRSRTGSTIAGLLALLVAISAVVLLVTDYIFEKTTAVATTVGVVATFVALWYGLPLYSRLRRG